MKIYFFISTFLIIISLIQVVATKVVVDGSIIPDIKRHHQINDETATVIINSADGLNIQVVTAINEKQRNHLSISSNSTYSRMNNSAGPKIGSMVGLIINGIIILSSVLFLKKKFSYDEDTDEDLRMPSFSDDRTEESETPTVVGNISPFPDTLASLTTTAKTKIPTTTNILTTPSTKSSPMKKNPSINHPYLLRSNGKMGSIMTPFGRRSARISFTREEKRTEFICIE